MTHNDLHPLWMEIKYAVGTRLHVKRTPLLPDAAMIVTPGELPADYAIKRKDGTSDDFGTIVDEYMAVVTPIYHTGVSFITADLWYKATVDSDPLWLTVYEIGAVGEGGTTPVTDGQLVLSCRTQNGGKYMEYWMESSIAVNLKDDFPFSSTNISNLGNFLKGVTSPVVGRDGGYVVANVRYITKTNDALRKKRLLDA